MNLGGISIMRSLIVAAILLVATGHTLAQPPLDVRPDAFDFGIVPRYSTIYKDFWIHNPTADTIRIRKINTGCDCASMPLERSVIAPGDSVLAEFSWEHGRKEGAGSRIPHIFVEGIEDGLAVTMTANVSATPDSAWPLAVKPFKCELSRAGGVSVDSVVLALKNRSSEDIKLFLAATPSDYCQYAFPSSVPANSTARAVVKIKPEYADQEFESSITIGILDNRKKRLTIPLRRKFY